MHFNDIREHKILATMRQKVFSFFRGHSQPGPEIMGHLVILILLALTLMVLMSMIGWFAATQKRAVTLGNQLRAKRRALEYHQTSAASLLENMGAVISGYVDFEKKYNQDYFKVLTNAFRSEIPGEKMVNVISGFGIPASKVNTLLGEHLRTMKELHYQFKSDLGAYLEAEAEYLSVVESGAAGLFPSSFWSGKSIVLGDGELRLIPDREVNRITDATNLGQSVTRRVRD